MLFELEPLCVASRAAADDAAREDAPHGRLVRLRKVSARWAWGAAAEDRERMLERGDPEDHEPPHDHFRGPRRSGHGHESAALRDVAAIVDAQVLEMAAHVATPKLVS